MPVPLEQFTAQLVESSLMSAEEVRVTLDGLGTGTPTDGEQLAKLLVKQKRLTPFQAQQIYAGKGKSLALGNYIILDKLGQGGMGMVLKAEHRRMKRVVALKVLSPLIVKNPQAMARFQREVEAAAKLEHPNIVTAYDADEANKTHFLVMQFVDGTDLSALVKSQGVLSVEKALPCIIQAAKGLAYAHSKGVIHRDIKPANLLLDREGTIKILDMGLARLASAGADQDQLTGTGQIMGTVDYMAPEQAMDTKSADARADIYSLGITLWYLLTGRAAYTGETAVSKLMAHQKNPIPSLRAVCPQVSADLEVVFTRMVAKTPEARYQSMTEVIADLERCQGGQPLSAPTIATAREEVSQFNDFLRQLEASENAPTKIQVRTRSKPASTDVGEHTVTIGGAQVDTDSQMHTKSLSTRRGNQVSSSAWWRQRPNQVLMAVAGGLILMALGLMFALNSGDRNLVVVKEHPPVRKDADPPPSRANDNTPPFRVAGVAWHGWPADAPRAAIAPFDSAQARRHQEEWATYLKVPLEYTNSIGMKFILIPPGEFLMGTSPEEADSLRKRFGVDNPSIEYHLRMESLLHEVVLTRPMYVSIHEVTQHQFERVTGKTPSVFSKHGKGKIRDIVVARGIVTDHFPVDSVNWNDAAQFCDMLSRSERLPPCYGASSAIASTLTGTGYRMLTITEAEYAARAGTTTRYWSGNDQTQLVLSEYYNSSGSKTVMTKEVGKLRPNPFGLFDTLGNVREWCHDGDLNSYRGGLEIDPIYAQGSKKGYRHGDAFSEAFYNRSAARSYVTPTTTDAYLGFRILLSVEGVKKSQSTTAIPVEAIQQAQSPVTISTTAQDKSVPVAHSGSKRIDILALIDPQRDTVSGRWQQDGTTLVGGGTTAVTPHNEKLQSQYAPPAEYDTTIVLERIGNPTNDRAFTIIFPKPMRFQLLLDWFDFMNTGHGIALINGQFPRLNGTEARGFEFNQGKVTVECRVRKGSIQVLINGVERINWNGSMNDLSVHEPPWATPDDTKLALGLQRASYRIHEWTLTPVSQDANPANPAQTKQTVASEPARAKAPFDSLQAAKLQADWAAHLGVPVEIKHPNGMRFRLIPPGEFIMGSDSLSIASDEVPHSVQIPQTFYAAVHETTRGQYQAFIKSQGATAGVPATARSRGFNAQTGLMEEHPKYRWDQPGFVQQDDHPVVQVSWHEATAYCAWLSRQGMGTYRLPTEAEWEYLARAGSRERYLPGVTDANLHQFGNIPDLALRKAVPGWNQGVTLSGNDGQAFTCRVGLFPPNAFGLHDLLGNATEWCQDWYVVNYQDLQATKVPVNPMTGMRKVVRGLAWNAFSPLSNRYLVAPDWAQCQCGFRIILEYDPGLKSQLDSPARSATAESSIPTLKPTTKSQPKNIKTQGGAVF